MLTGRKEKGLNLIELLIGLSIFATCFIMIMGIFPTGIKAVQHGKNILLAAHIAEQQMEYVKSLDFSNVTSSNLQATTIAMTSIVQNVTQNLSYDVSYSITYPLNGHNDLKAVRVQVSWFEGQATSQPFPRTVSSETIIYNPE